MSIYPSAEDSFLMQNTIIKYLKKFPKLIYILDLGTGSGIQAKTCRNLDFNNILTADINLEAVNKIKKFGIKSIKSNLFSNLKNNKFDLIIFNPPYLPEDKREPKDSKIQTTAGKKGYELIIKFLEQSTTHLTKTGSIVLLFSSLSNPKIILNTAKKLNFNYKLLNKMKLFFEELYVFKFQLRN